MRWNVATPSGNPRSGTRRFDAFNPTSIEPIQLSAARRPTALVFSADARLLAVGFEGFVEVWRWPALFHVGSLFDPGKGGRAAVRKLAFTPGGETLLAVGESGLLVADLKQMRLTARYRLPSPADAPVRDAAFAPDGRHLALACGKGGVRFLDAVTGAEQHGYAWPIGPAWSVCFAPDGLTCAAGGENGQVVVWDADT